MPLNPALSHMRPITFAALLILLSTSSACESQISIHESDVESRDLNLTGLVYGPLDYWAKTSGTCIYENENSALLDCLNFDFFERHFDQQKMVVTSREERYPGVEHALFRVVSAQEFGPAPEGYNMYYMGCEVNGTHRTDVMAYVRFDDNEWYEDVLKAWSIDTESGRMYGIETSGIRCRNKQNAGQQN